MFASKDIFLKSSAGTGPYTIPRSVRFRSSASAYLNRTFSTPTNSLKWTWSGWVKNCTRTGYNPIFGTDSNSGGLMYFHQTDNALQFYDPSTGAQLYTTALYRDPSSWYHILFVYDSTQATAADRMNWYVNGVKITSFAFTSYPTQNQAGTINTAVAHYLGRHFSALAYANSYMTEINFIDGQALTPSSFGAISSTTGVWQPIAYTGTYGTNGFYLKFNSFATAAALGTDSSGNGNTWTVNNLSVTAGTTYDSMTDVPTLTSATAANYPTWNPLWQGRTNTPTNGNIDYPASSIGIGTMALSGSSYWEITSTGGTSTVALYSTTASTSQTVTTGLTYGFRFNATTGAFDYTTNGSSFTSIATGLTSGPYFFYVSTAASTTASLNAGQQGFTYTPPSGFVALNTYNLPTPTIANGAAYMAATTYTGNGSTQTISNTVNGVSFQPDFVWLKARSTAYAPIIYDSLRGATLELQSSTGGAESTQATGVTAFGSTGFNLGALARANGNSVTFIGWQWYTNGGSSSSNTNGTITSTVSAGATQGFSMVTYTGTGTAGTVGHGLGVTPSIVMVKARSAATNWFIYDNTVATPQSQYLQLNSGNAQTTAASFWSTAATSSVFGIGTSANINGNAVTFVAYCFAAVAGFSAIGRYTGNGANDGPFIYLGFRPRFLLIKSTSTAAEYWDMFDTSRANINVGSTMLLANLTNTEYSGTYFDVLSNGFKIRESGASSPGGFNTSSSTYLYMAFAENPFKYSLAR
jgi:hypothetical protein